MLPFLEHGLPVHTCEAVVSRRVHITAYAFEAGLMSSGCTHGGGKPASVAVVGTELMHPSLDNATISEDGRNGLALAFISYSGRLLAVVKGLSYSLLFAAIRASSLDNAPSSEEGRTTWRWHSFLTHNPPQEMNRPEFLKISSRSTDSKLTSRPHRRPHHH